MEKKDPHSVTISICQDATTLPSKQPLRSKPKKIIPDARPWYCIEENWYYFFFLSSVLGIFGTLLYFKVLEVMEKREILRLQKFEKDDSPSQDGHRILW